MNSLLTVTYDAQVNPVYISQLLSILELGQSVGIIGGTSKSSLFLIGHQDTKLLYLDPHQLQPAAFSDHHVATYRCDAVRVLAAESMDSSASFGFLCRDKGASIQSQGNLYAFRYYEREKE